MTLVSDNVFPLLRYFAADNICSAEVAALFSTRNGGVSGLAPGEEHYKSLNFQFFLEGDGDGNVAENYRIIASSQGFRAEDVVSLHQKHTDRIIAVDEPMAAAHGLSAAEASNNQNPSPTDRSPLTTDRLRTGAASIQCLNEEADALVTDLKGILLSVRTADCVPVLLYDGVKKAVAAVHSGWRGTYQQIGIKTVKRMTKLYGTDPADIKAAIGPAIGGCCYEVDMDFHERFRSEFGNAIDKFFSNGSGGKPYCNLSAMNKSFLIAAGIPEQSIDISGLCTMCNPGLFYSHRRSGFKRGSMAAFIGMRDN